MKMWICTDKDGTQWFISSVLIPVYNKKDDVWECAKGQFNNRCFIGYNKYPEVTFENSPMEVEFIIKR